MRSKMNFVLLCAIGLFAIVHCQDPSEDELKKYARCFNTFCKDPSARKEFIDCHSELTPKELQSIIQNFKRNFYPLASDTFSEGINEICSFKKSTELKVADKIVEANFFYQKKAAANGEGSESSGLKHARNCSFKLLQRLRSDGKC